MSQPDRPECMPRLVHGLLVAVGGVLLVALVLGMIHHLFDYDEIEHAHVTWLISRGDVPFRDFFECHPPFFWYAFAPLSAVLTDVTVNLYVFRAVAVLANLVSLGLLFANLRLGRSMVWWPYSALAIALVAVPRQNLDFLVEFRPDSWCILLLLAGLLLVRLGRPRSVFTRYAVFAFLMSLSVLIAPKYPYLVVLFSAIDLLRWRSSGRTLAAVLAGHACGIGAAAAAAVLFLGCVGVDPLTMFKLVVEYHLIFLRHTEFQLGLVTALWGQTLPTVACALGACCWLFLVLRRELRASCFEVAIALFLGVQLLVCHLPYKQYVAPWLLFAATFVHFVEPVGRRLSPHLPRALLLALLAAVAVEGVAAAHWYTRHSMAKLQRDFFTVVESIQANLDGKVVAPLLFHPVRQRDVFYGWVRTVDRKGYETEKLMQEWGYEPYSSRFRPEYYQQELERHAPALIFLLHGSIALAPDQGKVLGAYMEQHRADYTKLRTPLGELLVKNDTLNRAFVLAPPAAAPQPGQGQGSEAHAQP